MEKITRDEVKRLQPSTLFVAVHNGREDLCIIFDNEPIVTIRKLVDEMYRTKEADFVIGLDLLHEKTNFFLPNETEFNMLLGALLSTQQQMKQ